MSGLGLTWLVLSFLEMFLSSFSVVGRVVGRPLPSGVNPKLQHLNPFDLFFICYIHFIQKMVIPSLEED